MKYTTLTIGIPAYNEEVGIVRLLADISTQKTSSLKLNKVIIYSDGSNDATVKNSKKYQQLPIVVIDGKKRKGKANALNEIIKQTDSEVLIIFDADICLVNDEVLEQLARPINEQKVDLTGARVVPSTAKNYFEKLLSTSLRYKQILFEAINQGDNIYTCHGRARAFSKELYQSINFRESLNEDAYSYLFSKYHGYRYHFCPDAVVSYTLPIGFEDHKLQSIRFFQSMNSSIEEFGREFVESAYRIPFMVLITTLPIFVIKNPSMIAYLFLMIYLKIKSKLIGTFDNNWQISKSSKATI